MGVGGGGCKLQINGRTPSSNLTTGRRGWAWGLLWCDPFVMYIKFMQGPFHLTGHCKMVRGPEAPPNIAYPTREQVAVQLFYGNGRGPDRVSARRGCRGGRAL